MTEETLSRDRAKTDDYYASVRQDALGGIDPAGKRILDVGCGSGATGALLKRNGAREVVGIEIVPEAARKAEAVLDRVLCGDITRIPLDFPPGAFDLILCLDVLEHLAYPEDALKRLLPLLAEGGRVVVSIPNMRYIGALKKLIFEADWPREPSGVFDGTHLRWFTAKSATRMFNELGLTVVSRRRNPSNPFVGLVRKHPGLSRYLNDWFTTQFLFVLERRSPTP
jgi:SAM-dependent methyltransferase